MKVLVSRYQSMNMQCIVAPVKFDDRLSISFLRKKQIFTKKMGIKSIHFQKSYNFQKHFKPRHLEKGQGTSLEKVTFFLHLNFILNGIDNQLLNLMWIWMCFSSID
jgi:hypothetical protein